MWPKIRREGKVEFGPGEENLKLPLDCCAALCADSGADVGDGGGGEVAPDTRWLRKT